MKKTFISILSLALIAFLALTACGGNDNNDASRQESSATASTEETSLTESVESDESSSEDVSEESITESSEAKEKDDESTQAPSETSSEDPSEDSAETAVSKELTFRAKYVNTGIDTSKTLPYAVVIDSDSELTSYYLTNKNACGLDSDYKNAIKDYDVNFFKDKALIMVACAENDNTITHEVSKAVLIEYSGNKWLNIEIKRLGGDGTGTQAGRHIIIELDRECLEARNSIAVNLIDG